VRAHIEDGWPEGAPATNGSHQAGALRSWLVRGTHKVAIHPRRRTGSNRETREVLAADAGWVPGEQSGWRGLVSALQRHTVLNALGQLRKGDRDILTMAYLEGHTNDEIARMLQVSVRTVSRRLSAALAELEKHARNVGIWLAAFGLVVLAGVQRRFGVLTRSDGWQASALATAGVVTVATVAFVNVAPATPAAAPSTFSPFARSVNAHVQFGTGPSSFAPTTIVSLETTTNPEGKLKHSKPAHESSATSADPSQVGCHSNPTSAAPSTPVGAHGGGSPVTHPGKGGCGPNAA
jgi:RNA polymerase sigma factor (sigma-70 family)